MPDFSWSTLTASVPAVPAATLRTVVGPLLVLPRVTLL